MNDLINFDHEITFLIDGVEAGSGMIMIRGGKMITDDAEIEFYNTLRKNEKQLVEESLEEEKAHIIDHLTQEQEDKLKKAHAKDYHGTDDDMSDAYEDWLMDLPLEEIKEII